MIGRGMPMSQSSAPFPKVMVASIYVGIAGVKFHRRGFRKYLQLRTLSSRPPAAKSPLLIMGCEDRIKTPSGSGTPASLRRFQPQHPSAFGEFGRKKIGRLSVITLVCPRLFVSRVDAFASRARRAGEFRCPRRTSVYRLSHSPLERKNAAGS